MAVMAVIVLAPQLTVAMVATLAVAQVLVRVLLVKAVTMVA